VPFTPFHLGPALCLAIPLRRYIHAPTFILASLVLDIEPLLVLIFGLNYPLHGYFHTLIAAIGVGFVFGLAMFCLESIMHPLYRTLLLVPETPFSRRQFLLAAVLGTILHVLFDSPLYSDIKPFFPSTLNPLYGLAYSLEIYILCILMGILGIIFYFLLILSKQYWKTRGKSLITEDLHSHSR